MIIFKLENYKYKQRVLYLSVFYISLYCFLYFAITKQICAEALNVSSNVPKSLTKIVLLEKACKVCRHLSATSDIQIPIPSTKDLNYPSCYKKSKMGESEDFATGSSVTKL